jgi:RHS repeat-associated protein
MCEMAIAKVGNDKTYYSYDLDGNILSRTYPNALKTSYTYNAANEKTTAKVGKDLTLYTYDADGKLASTLHPNGVLDTRSYDAAGRATEIAGADAKGRPLYSRAYSYDPVGNPLTRDATAPRDHSPGWWGKPWRYRGADLTKWSETYSYDSQNRLTKACMNESCSRYFAYTYDGVGNMLSKTTEDATTTDSYDAADELLSASRQERGHHHPDVTNYSYDLNGNETRAGDASYSYNLENELIQVSGEHGHDRVSYSYAEDGLMQTRSTHSEKTSYAWDRSFDTPELAIETDSKGEGRFQMKDSRSYSYGEGPIGIEAGRDSVTFHTDSLGSVVQLSDEKGKLLQSYRYSPYGGDYSSTSSLDAKSDDLNPIRFTGQYLDSETELYNMRAREYDPETARFLETDPVSCEEGGACGSVYVYVDDRPTVLTDPSGECPIDNATPTCMKGWKNPKPIDSSKCSSPCPKNYPVSRRGAINGRPNAPGTTHQYKGDGYWADSNALDINVPRGTTVCAIFSGRVLPNQCGYLDASLPDSAGMHGQRLHLRSNIMYQGLQVEAYYAHLDKITVSCGSIVKKGQIIGRSGIAASAPHLHIAFYPAHVDVYRFIPYWRP